jgi:hypothetical protein
MVQGCDEVQTIDRCVQAPSAGQVKEASLALFVKV